MKPSSFALRSSFYVLLVVVLHAAGLLLPGAAANSVTQAWSVHINGPLNTPLSGGFFSVGPSGDVFVAGHFRGAGVFNHDILVDRWSSAGTLVWERRYEPAEEPTANLAAVSIVARGTNVYVAGGVTGTNGTSQDFLTLKYRETGELEWSARLDGVGHEGDSPVGIAVDGQGNVLVVGDSTSTNGATDIVVLKYAPSGNLLWTYTYDGPTHGSDRSVGIRLDADGNVHVAGMSAPWTSQSAAVTFKLNPDGQVLWIAREVSGDAYNLPVIGLDLDQAGRVVTVGHERSHCVTRKYDANGNRQWTARYRAEEPASMQAVRVHFDHLGNVITAANLFGSGTNDAVLIKYAVDGQQLWATRIAFPDGVSHLNTLDVDGDGNSYVTMTPAADAVTVKVSPDGAQLWSIAYNSQGFFYDYGEFLEVTPSGDIFVSGRSIYFAESFISLVKYTQQPATGMATAVVTPALQVVDPGANVVFTAEASGPGPVRFHWRKNGRLLGDETNAILTIADVAEAHRGDYSVVVSNLAGATISPEARLSVRVPPVVSVTPTQTVGYVGTDTAFFANVPGNEFVTLQWRRDGTNISGATNDVLQFTNLTAADAGRYDVVAMTTGGTATSSIAGLRISSAVELVETTPNQSEHFTWEYAPLLRVLPAGEFLIAARSNPAAGSDILLTKHATNGAILWSTTFESAEFTNAEPFNLLLDGAGNIYISGVSRQPYLPAAVAVLKFSPAGQLLWSRVLTGTNLWGSVHSFAVAPNGDSAVAMLGANGTMIVRYSAAGDLLWTIEDPSPETDWISLAVDASGNSYLGTTILAGAINEVLLRKFDATGAIAWVRPFAPGMHSRLGIVTVDSTGHPILTGTGAWANTPEGQMFVAKYSPAGQKLWETRTGTTWREIASIAAVAIGPGDDITVLTESDDDYEPGEESGVTRISSDGQLRYRVKEREILVGRPTQLALDNFGNAYVTGYGWRPGTGLDAATAKYDAYGNRPWLVYYGGLGGDVWQYGLGVGADAAGDVRVLASDDFYGEFRVLHYRQRDPAGSFRVQIIPDGAGTFHLASPTAEPFQIEASTDLQNWTVLGAAETQQLLQPGATAFSGSPRRFFRLILAE